MSTPEERFDDFMSDLHHLLQRHNVSICVSGYDGLEVHDNGNNLLTKLIWCNGIENKIGETK